MVQQVHIAKTLDVEVVERELAKLWKQAGQGLDEDTAVLRCRVANLLVFVPREAELDEVEEMISELTKVHPSRVLIMLGKKDAEDHDIEMYVASICQTDKRSGAKRLCCEEVTLKAFGKFAVELPSAALPLLVPDLSTFLWWRDALDASDKILSTLLQSSNRLVVDSADLDEPNFELLEINHLFNQSIYQHVGISDLNWARLTFWQELLADFYDVPAYRSSLAEIDLVRIEYVAAENAPDAVAPQALLMAGWLASRLGWTVLSEQTPGENEETVMFRFSSQDRGSSPTVREGVNRGRSPTVTAGVDEGSSPTVREVVNRGSSPEGVTDREIKIELKRVKRGERRPGRLVKVELLTSGRPAASFSVTRSADNLHIFGEARLGPEIHPGRVLPVRNRSLARLLGREMEILGQDTLYQEALAVATNLVKLPKSSHSHEL